jgi:glycerol-3-phosphate dehydrogenase
VSTDGDCVVVITGGKLTTYRVMANDTMKAVATQLGRSLGRDVTRSQALPGGDFSSLAELTDAADRAIVNRPLAAHLAETYGTRWRVVWQEVSESGGGDRLEDGLPYVAGELRYAIRREMACTLADLLVRRTHIAFETRDHGGTAAERAVLIAAPLLGWDRAARSRALDDYAREVERLFAIDA